MTGPAGRRVRLVARTELRRTWRGLRSSTRGTLLLLGGLLLVPAYSLAIGAAAYFGASFLPDANPQAVRLAATGVLGGAFGIAAFVVLQRTVKQIGEPDGLDGLLTTVPYRVVLAGVVLAELGRLLAVLALPLVALAVPLAVGLGAPLVAPVVLALVGLVAVAGGLAGVAGGLAVKLVAARSAFVARHRASVGALSSFGFVAGWVALSSVPAVQLTALRLATRSPLSWVVDPVLLAVPGATGGPARALVAVGGLLAGLGVATVACDRLAVRVWYGDAVQPDHEFAAADRTLSDRLLAGRVPTATRVVAQKSWRRARRSPFTVQFAIAPFFLLVYQLQTVLLAGEVPPTLPLTAGLATAAAVGAAFTLNPLGGEEGLLPLTLTADVSGRAFVAGLALAGLAPGVVATTLLVAGAGLAAGTAPLVLAAALATSLVATAAAPAVAAGAGIVFPKFERSSVQGRTVTVPSGWAFLLYFTVFGAAVAPGSAAVAVAVEPAFSLPVGRPALLAGGVGATLLLAAGAAVVGFGYAADRVATYRLE
ncbi:hypothetical protein [Haloarcula litorea]|uniref:hypothetical protein n=1 Tax=Haloarcula litorea TaxID=3032579 RepID=UPI0023E8ABAD|nr:hypothetical protein [Halomicroarcula sp. GDY20]